jgi:serine/threonine-protein kinase
MRIGPESVVAKRYRLISLLGRGGMGEVWRAEQLDLKAHVAVKILNPTLSINGESLQRFNREAQAAAALRSPHVVQILEHGFDSELGVAFIAMEMMEGESLAQRLRRVNRLSQAETARVISHVARALSRAHEAGIVHRDLKPDNVFLVANEDEEVAKVLDFGVAKAKNLSLDTATRTGAVMGTPYYMSPEQIAGEKSVDFRTDLWALGVIACECLTGRRPFDAESLGGLAIAICTKPTPRPSTLAPVPAAFDAWFERAVARDPEGRFQSARELAEALRRALQSGSEVVASAAPEPLPTVKSDGAPSVVSVVPLSRTTPADSPSEPRSRRRTRLIPLALLAACGLGAAVWAFGLRAEQSPSLAASADAALPKATELTSASPPAAPEPPAHVAPPEPEPAPAPSQSAQPAHTPPPSVVPVPAGNVTSSASRSPAVSAPKPRTRPSTSPASPASPNTAPPSAPSKPAEDSGSIFDRRKG